MHKKFVRTKRRSTGTVYDVTLDGVWVCAHVEVNGAIRIAYKEHQILLLMKMSPAALA